MTLAGSNTGISSIYTWDGSPSPPAWHTLPHPGCHPRSPSSKFWLPPRRARSSRRCKESGLHRHSLSQGSPVHASLTGVGHKQYIVLGTPCGIPQRRRHIRSCLRASPPENDPSVTIRMHDGAAGLVRDCQDHCRNARLQASQASGSFTFSSFNLTCGKTCIRSHFVYGNVFSDLTSGLAILRLTNMCVCFYNEAATTAYYHAPQLCIPTNQPCLQFTSNLSISAAFAIRWYLVDSRRSVTINFSSSATRSSSIFT